MRPWLACLVLFLVGCGEATAPPDADPARLDAAVDAGLDVGPIPGEVRPTPPPCGALVGAFPARTTPTAAATLPPLHVDGAHLLDDAGHEVALRGVNLGSWLQTESWILGLGLGYDDDFLARMGTEADARGIADLLSSARATNAADLVLERAPRWAIVQAWRAPMWRLADPARRDAVASFWAWFDEAPWLYEEESLWAYFDRRFGADASSALRTELQDRWITELDLERIAALGLNVVRAPIWYRQLEEDLPDGTARPRADGWQRLDRLVEWARTHHLYVILDLHGAPGGQSVYDHQGLRYGGALFAEQACLDRASALLAALAAHFAGEPHVAAIDLLNEPQSPSASEWARVHDALYRAVRGADTARVVIAEDGYGGPGRVRSPSELGWSQAMFSIHAYPSWSSPSAYGDAILGSLDEWSAVWSARFGCPMLLGELNAASGAPSGAASADEVMAMADALSRLAPHGVHWTVWTWRFQGESTWGVYHPPAGQTGFFDPTGHSLDEVRARFDAMSPDAWVPVDGYPAALSASAAQPVVPTTLP